MESLNSQSQKAPFKKVQVNIVRQQNIKDAKYIVVEDLDKVNFKWLQQQAKNKFKTVKVKAIYVLKTNKPVENEEQLREVIYNFSIEFYREIEQKPNLTLVLSEKDLPKQQLNNEVQDSSDISNNIDEEEKDQLPKNDIQQVQQQNANNKIGKIKIIAKETLIDEESMKQLYSAAKLEGCLFAFGMPDLHPGKGIPIGASVITENIIYPELVDQDIGCGMCFLKTGIQVSKLTMKKLETIKNSLVSIDCPWSKNEQKYLDFFNQEFDWGSNHISKLDVDKLEKKHLQTLGTIGGGNHFAEFQEIVQIIDQESADRIGLDSNEVYMLVHSGSRSLGETIYVQYMDKTKHLENKGCKIDSVECQEYLQSHDLALNFARRNRMLIAHRILKQIDSRKQNERSQDQKDNIQFPDLAVSSSDCIIDIHHNFVEQQFIQDEESKLEKQVWVHRKGATPSNHSEFLVIPGSRGSYSYLVKVNKQNTHISGYSLAHGAGRKMNRSKALAINKNKHPNANELLKTDFDSLVVCENKQLVYEEAPTAYKNIDSVVRDLVEFELVTIVAQLKPLLTYKFKEPGFGNSNLKHRYDSALHCRKRQEKEQGV
eukprot:403344686